MKNASVLRLVIFTILSAPWQAIAQQAQEPARSPSEYGFGPWHMSGGPWHMGGYAGWWMFGVMLLILLAFFAVMFLLVRRPSGHGGRVCGLHGAELEQDDVTRSALRMLNERFARGEIQKEEYAEKKAALLSSG